MRIDAGLPPCRELPCGAAAFFFGRFAAQSSLAFPLGGRWHGEAVTDEGADFGLGLLYAGGISPPRRRVTFCPGRK